MGFSEQQGRLSMPYTFADLVFRDYDQGLRSETWVEHLRYRNMKSWVIEAGEDVNAFAVTCDMVGRAKSDSSLCPSADEITSVASANDGTQSSGIW
jgi:hypothetical protein